MIVQVFLQKDWELQKSWRRFLPHPIVTYVFSAEHCKDAMPSQISEDVA